MHLQIKGVKRHVVRKKGKEYIYYRHRKTGTKIKSNPGTAAFLSELERLNKGPVKSKTGTLFGLFDEWRQSPEWSRLALVTRKDYEKVIMFLSPLWDMPLHEINKPFVVRLRDEVFKARKRRFANYVVAVVSSALTWGALRGLVETNAARGVPKIASPKGAAKQNARWPNPERFIEQTNGAVKVATGLALYAGIRQGDILSLTWSAVQGDWLVWRQSKTGEFCEAHIPTPLKAILAETERKGPLIVTGSRGAPLTSEGFRTLWQRAQGRQGTFHGLRTTFAARLKEQGWTEEAIQAAMGHTSRDSQRPYTSEVTRRAVIEGQILRLEQNETKTRNRTTSRKRRTTPEDDDR